MQFCFPKENICGWVGDVSLQLRMDNLLHAASGYKRKITMPLDRGTYILFVLAVDPPQCFSTLPYLICGSDSTLFVCFVADYFLTV